MIFCPTGAQYHSIAGHPLAVELLGIVAAMAWVRRVQMPGSLEMSSDDRDQSTKGTLYVRTNSLLVFDDCFTSS